MKNESQPKAMDNNKLDVLAEIVLNFPRTREFSEDHVVINDILDDIITNTLSISSLKLNTIKWKGKEKVYDLRIINKDQNKFELQSLQENRCNQYLQAESRWKLKFSQLKTQLQHKEQKLQQLYELTTHLLTCRPPSQVYSIYLMEQWLNFQLTRFIQDNAYQINFVQDFISIYSDCVEMD